MASPSIYTNRPVNSGEFRLLEPVEDQDEALSYKLHVRLLEQCPVYTALSYTWNIPEARKAEIPMHEIMIDGYPFRVRQNLKDFLEQARLDDSIGLLWIDAICINQEDEREKSAQVERMGEIYSKATKVHAWLGKRDCKSDQTDQIDILFGVLQEFSDRKTNEECPAFYDEAERLSYYRDLFCDIYLDKAGGIPENSDSDDEILLEEFNWLRPLYKKSYWARVWIVQELVLAKDVLVRYGVKSIHFDEIYGLSLDWGSFEMGFDTGNHQKYKESSRGWSTIQAIRGHRRRREFPFPEMQRQNYLAKLDEVIRIYAQHHKCEDPKDKVYGFRELVPQWKKNLVVNYKQPALNVFLDVAKLGLFEPKNHGGWEVAFCLWEAMKLDKTQQFQDYVKNSLPEIYSDYESRLKRKEP